MVKGTVILCYQKYLTNNFERTDCERLLHID